MINGYPFRTSILRLSEVKSVEKCYVYDNLEHYNADIKKMVYLNCPEKVYKVTVVDANTY